MKDITSRLFSFHHIWAKYLWFMFYFLVVDLRFSLKIFAFCLFSSFFTSYSFILLMFSWNLFERMRFIEGICSFLLIWLSKLFSSPGIDQSKLSNSCFFGSFGLGFFYKMCIDRLSCIFYRSFFIVIPLSLFSTYFMSEIM